MFSPHLDGRRSPSEKERPPLLSIKRGIAFSSQGEALVQSLDALEYELDKVFDAPLIVGIHVEILPPGNNAAYRHGLMP